MNWGELLQTIILACSIHATDSAEKTIAAQRECQAKLAQCFITDYNNNKNKQSGSVLIDCLAKR